MAKAGTKRGPKGESKSAAVRSYFEANPQAKNSEVIEALKGMGVEVSANYVSILRSQQKRKTRGGRRGRRPATAPASGNGHMSVDQIRAAAVLIKTCDGVEGARRAINMAEKIAEALR